MVKFEERFNVKKAIIIQILIILFILFSCSTEKICITNFVNPFIGTGGSGNTYPGAQLPFGMVQLSPDTRSEGMPSCGGYKYADSSIIGFSHTHLNGVGEPEFLDILFMPTVGKLNINPGNEQTPSSGYRSRFSHNNEIANPGYYSVLLDDYNTNVELTATERCGFHKYTFPQSDSSHIIIDLTHAGGVEDLFIKKVSDTEIEGLRRSHGWAYNQYVYFVAKFSEPFSNFEIAVDNKLNGDIFEARGKNIKAVISYSTKKNKPIFVKVGISAVSTDGARKNLEIEIQDWDFDKIRNSAKKKWNTELGKIEIEGGTKNQQTVFYTSMYHAAINPIIFMDVDRKYRGIDNKIHTASSFTNYSVFSLWDTFRGFHPLMTIINQDRTNDFIRSLNAKYDDGGKLPMWALAGNYTDDMLGFHATSVIADAYIKGIRDYDVDKVYRAMKEIMNMDRLGLKYYKQIGYLPYNRQGESVSKTLEYCYNDWCISQMAKALGNDEDYQTYNKRAHYYKNVFDTTTNFMRGKGLDRKWLEPFDPLKNSAYSEGNAYQYLFVPHDTEGLIELMGGDKVFDKWLDKLFSLEEKNSHVGNEGVIGQYWHGNEPGHHLPYLYNYVGKPWKSQEIVNEILTKINKNTPAGIAGNDDCGQMAAWYILSSIGFYSVSPGQDIYVFGTPLFEKVSINLENGNRFIIAAKNRNDKNIYIQSATLNGNVYNKSFIKHADIMNGGKLTFTMGAEPNKVWGSEKKNRPYSENGNNVVPNPYIKSTPALFKVSTSLELLCDTENAKIHYTINGNNPDIKSKVYSNNIEITDSTVVKMFASKKGIENSSTVEYIFNKTEYAKPVTSKEFSNGLNYKYYERFFVITEDLEKAISIEKGTIDNFSIKNAKREKYFGYTFQGYIQIEKDDIYTFYVESNDGTRLYINDIEIIENDGNHGSIEESASVALKAGFHKIKLNYMQCGGGKKLKVSWECSGFSKQEIDKSHLFTDLK